VKEAILEKEGRKNIGVRVEDKCYHHAEIKKSAILTCTLEHELHEDDKQCIFYVLDTLPFQKFCDQFFIRNMLWLKSNSCGFYDTFHAFFLTIKISCVQTAVTGVYVTRALDLKLLSALLVDTKGSEMMSNGNFATGCRI